MIGTRLLSGVGVDRSMNHGCLAHDRRETSSRCCEFMKRTRVLTHRFPPDHALRRAGEKRAHRATEC